MATATRAKSGRRQQRCRAWIDEHGETRWECPECLQEHAASLKKCGCGYVHPPLANISTTAFRQTAGHDLPASQSEAAEKEAAADLLPGITVNRFGIVTEGQRRIDVEFPKSLGVTASIEYAEIRPGQWEFGYEVDMPGGSGSGHAISIDSPIHYPAETECLVRAFESVETRIRSEQSHANTSAANRKKLARALQVLEQFRQSRGVDHPIIAACTAERTAEGNRKPKQKAAKTKEPEPTKICNRCNTVHVAAKCPECGCPEYRLEQTPAEPGQPVYEELDVPIDIVVFRDDNPRNQVDQAYIARLAESLDDVGLLNKPIGRWVCPEDGAESAVEVWAGECRARAWQVRPQFDIPGVLPLPMKVYPADTPDKVMQAIRAEENRARQDLNPIQEALNMQQDLKTGRFAGQRELAKHLGISQTEVSMRIRLAELPAEWQAEVIAHGMTEGAEGISTSHAKHVFPWLERPQVLEKALKLAAEWRKARGRRPNEKDFAGIVDDAVRKCTRTLSKPGYCQHGCEFKVTPELTQQLDVIEVSRPWGGGKERRAFNVKLYDQQQKAAKARKKEREAKAAAETPAAGGNKTRKPKPPEFRMCHETAIERWAGRQIVAVLETKRESTLLWKLFLVVASGETWLDYGDEFARRMGAKAKGWLTTADWWRALAGKGLKEVEDRLRAWLIESLGTHLCYEDHRTGEPPPLLEVAQDLGADLETQWQPTAEDLKSWPRDELQALADQFGIEIPAKAKENKAVAAHLAKVWQPGNVPKEILAAAGIKA